MKQIHEGIYLDNGMYVINNTISKTGLGYVNDLIIKRAYAEYVGTVYQYQKRRWRSRIVWECLPKEHNTTLLDGVVIYVKSLFRNW